MNIKIVLEGKLKDFFWKAGVSEYQKRLFDRVEVVETNSILNYIQNKKQSYIVTMEIDGAEFSSAQFAQKIREIEQQGYYNEILFLIGGSDGLSSAVSAKSDLKLSMSKMTFLHQEAVLILIEQIYRANKILSNEPYHK